MLYNDVIKPSFINAMDLASLRRNDDFILAEYMGL